MAARRVLVVDDKSSSREFVRTILERIGYVVDEAEDGPGALEAIRSQTPDLVLLDLQMPGLTGNEVLEQLRREERYRDLPVVAFTASAMSGDRERALAAGFTGYLTKPVSVAVLRNEVLKLVPLV